MKTTKLTQRGQLLRLTRRYFGEQGFIEVETPLLVPQPSSEPYLEVFQTKLITVGGQSTSAFLTTSPEYAMKKLIADGSGSIFQICKSFRNGEESSPTHNSEFTMLEWYRVEANYRDAMKDCEQLIQKLAKELQHSQQLEHQGKTIDLSGSWQKLSTSELFEKWVGIKPESMLETDALRQVVFDHQLSQDFDLSYEEAFNLIFLNVIEPNLPQDRPTFVYNYPLPLAALAKESLEHPGYAERFELFIGGLELANAFSELIEPTLLRERQVADLAMRKALGKVEYGLDEDLLQAAEKGWPEMTGVALGFDRLVMLLTDSASIKEVIVFPTEQLFSI